MRCLDNVESLAELVELRKRNLQLSNRDTDVSDLNSTGGPASSVKRNTSFTKKLRTGAIHSQLDALISELSTLRLDKYLSEVVNAMVESKVHSSKDLHACVRIGYLLHERYAEFKDLMTSTLIKILTAPPTSSSGCAAQLKKEKETSRLLRQRTALGLLVEFYLIGIVIDPSKDYIIANMLKTLCMDERNCLVNSSIIVAFAKNYGRLFLELDCRSPNPTKDELAMDKDVSQHESALDGLPIDLKPYIDKLLPAPMRSSVRTILQTYYKWIVAALQREQKQIKQAGSSNYEHYIATGEVTCERQVQYKKLSTSYEKIMSVVNLLSKYLGFEEPSGFVYQTLAPGISVPQPEGRDVCDEKGPPKFEWDDKGLKAFYEDLIELKTVIPEPEDAQSAAKDDSRCTKDDPQNADEDDLQNNAMEDAQSSAEKAAVDEAIDSKMVALQQRSQINQLLSRLQDMAAAEDADDIAINFVPLNTKSARKKLLKCLLSVPRNRCDLLPLYARLIATLNQILPNLGADVICVVSIVGPDTSQSELEDEFSKNVKGKKKGPLSEKVKNIRYLGELVKFQIVPEHIALHCINRLLLNFRLLNIDLLCIFLETCGRFLYKHYCTNSRMVAALDTIKKKKLGSNISHRQAIMIDSAYYSCCPPEQPTIERKLEDPVNLYIRYLMLLTLSKKTVEKKLRQLRKLNWEDPQVVSYVKTCFLCTNNFKFTNMDIIAYMIHELVRYYPDFSVDVIDGVFELVKFGLEQNAYKHNQQRISAVRLVGELYNYKMIQSNVVFDTLYTIVCYGHENNIPRYMVSIPLDYTHDFFRVRLCCTLLKTCGQYFMTGKAGKRLGCFMCFLQMYLYSKEPYPADISVMVTEILETYCPTTKRFDCYIDAAESLIEILSNEDSDICPRLENAIGTIRMEIQRINTIDTNISQVVFENAPADHHEYAGESKFVYQKSISAHGYAQQSNDMSFSNTLPNNASSSNTLPNDEVTSCDSSNSIKEYPDSTCEEGIEAEELKDFDEMYNRLIQENEQCPMRASKSTCPVLPRGVVGKFHHKAAQEISENSNEITFIMLTKKNNKHVTLPLSLPKNTPFAANTLSRFIAEQEEKRQLKQLVLDYEQREISNIESEFAILENNEDGGHNAGPTHDCMSFNPNHRRPVSNSQDNSRCYPHQNQSDSPKRSSKASRGR